MTTTNLRNLWIHNAANYSDNIEFEYYRPVREDLDTEGDVRRYAGGRKRSIRRAGKLRTLTVDLRFVTRAQLESLRKLQGKLIMLRDNKGRVVFGVYHDINIDDRRTDKDAGVTLNIQEVTHSVEV